MKRTFIAIKINLSEEILSKINDIKTNLENEPIKWVETNNMHLTLKFLGDTTDDQIDAVIHVLDQIKVDFQSFSFDIKGCGVFKNIRQPRVLWFGIDQINEMKKIHNVIETELLKIGFEKEQRSFTPHLTLGRIKFIKHTEKLRKLLDLHKNQVFQKLEVKEITLFESNLTPQGPIYNSIHTIGLEER